MPKKISPEELEALKAANPKTAGSNRKHGIVLLHALLDDAPAADADDFVFKVPTRALWVQYRGNLKMALSGRGPADYASVLAKNCLLFPSVAEFEALRERAPAVTEEFGEILANTADDGMSVIEGKL